MPAPSRHERIIAIWLLATAAAVFVMVGIGGVTRLTGSGLSMVEWRPVFGFLPPLTEAEWRRVFDLYREIPQYQYVNRGMTLEEFRAIFWWEYIHRVWGRVIGLMFALPLVWFAIRGWIGRALGWKLVGLLALGGLQGFIGWWMVTSGFSERVTVSQYRLAIHLGLAFLILALLLMLALSLLRPGRTATPAPPHLASLSWIVVGFVSLTVLTGAFVAGTHAGWLYNTFPLMDGSLVPPGYGRLQPFWLNAFENPAAIQFHHRWIAMFTVALTLALWWQARLVPLAGFARTMVTLLPLAALAQAAIGIATLLLAVPLLLGVLHQVGAATVFALSIATAWAMRHAVVPTGFATEPVRA